jgi:hypothetical protein
MKGYGINKKDGASIGEESQYWRGEPVLERGASID